MAKAFCSKTSSRLPKKILSEILKNLISSGETRWFWNSSGILSGVFFYSWCRNFVRDVDSSSIPPELQSEFWLEAAGFTYYMYIYDKEFIRHVRLWLSKYLCVLDHASINNQFSRSVSVKNLLHNWLPITVFPRIMFRTTKLRTCYIIDYQLPYFLGLCRDNCF